jgi:hypothetical protein
MGLDDEQRYIHQAKTMSPREALELYLLAKFHDHWKLEVDTLKREWETMYMVALGRFWHEYIQNVRRDNIVLTEPWSDEAVQDNNQAVSMEKLMWLPVKDLLVMTRGGEHAIWRMFDALYRPVLKAIWREMVRNSGQFRFDVAQAREGWRFEIMWPIVAMTEQALQAMPVLGEHDLQLLPVEGPVQIGEALRLPGDNPQ